MIMSKPFLMTEFIFNLQGALTKATVFELVIN